MKTKRFRFFLLTLAAFCLPAMLLAQTPPVDTTGLDAWQPFDGIVTIESLQEVYYALYGAIVIIWGYVAKMLGFQKRKVPFVFVVLAGALVAAGVFLTQGFSAAGIVISFLASLGIFDLILKPGQKLFRSKVVVQ
jgi:hypothetical protein